jgi:hypothetical protein
VTAATRLVAEMSEAELAEKDGQNARLHWAARRHRASVWRLYLAYKTIDTWPVRLPWPKAVCTITCVARRGERPDDDNLAGMHKALRDNIAKVLGCDDSPRGPITWRYRWERGVEDQTVITLEERRDGADD